ncbi:TPA: fimbrial protein [Serratia fonticola]
MTIKIIAVIAMAIASVFNMAWADNSGKCYWRAQQGVPENSNLLQNRGKAPSTQQIKKTNIGEVITSAEIILNGLGDAKCPTSVKTVVYTYSIEGRELAEGFTNVYKTGVKGIGVRLRTNYNVLPFTNSYKNGSSVAHISYNAFTVEFIRTSQDVGSGTADMNFLIKLKFDDWNAREIRIIGTTPIENLVYFEGCSGVGNINIPMGKVAISELGTRPAKQFDLDVLCSGLPTGTKPPVNVWFEGDSAGTGRLNLLPGGAQGVEIALSEPQGTELPFTKAGALSMDWIRSQPDGEIYRLPIKAEYVKKQNQKVTAGKADAVLNYILEYR